MLSDASDVGGFLKSLIKLMESALPFRSSQKCRNLAKIFLRYRFHRDQMYTHFACTYTDESKILHTLLVKHYNDLIDRQSSERGKDEVTYFYVGDVFLYTPWD